MRAGRMIVAAVLLLAAGCTAAEPAAAPATTALPRPDPVAACVTQLTYWADAELRGAPDQGYDYQHMGLTADQKDALDAVVEAARRDGPGVVERLIRDACTRLATGPTSGPWGY
jgi:hypothetical protein